LSELGISDIAICGLAKRLEEIWLPNNSEPIIFPRHSEALYLLQRIRDEAHRFAINFHRSKRSKLMVESLLDEIDGLGETRRKALLAVFGSVTALKSASIDEISAVPGIGPKLAKVIFAKLIRQESIDTSTGEILDA
jgi:excinuclease ABC subunit C